MGKYKENIKFMTEDDMQKAFKEFCEGRSICCSAELSGVPHSCLQRCLRTGQDKPLKNENRRTVFSSEQD